MAKIYLIKSYNEDQPLYKIGFTKGNSMERLKQHSTGNPFDLELVFTFDTKFNMKVERILHRKYKSKHIRGEWFNLDTGEVDSFLDVCQEIENNLEFLRNNPFK